MFELWQFYLQRFAAYLKDLDTESCTHNNIIETFGVSPTLTSTGLLTLALSEVFSVDSEDPHVLTNTLQAVLKSKFSTVRVSTKRFQVSNPILFSGII